MNFSFDGNPNSSEDNEGHGTHVAGIIAVNSLSNVTIKPYKVLDSDGEGTDIQIILGVEAAIADGVEVINMSLGRSGYNAALHDSVKKAISKNIAVVVASGNDFVNLDNHTYSPASFPECITVMAHGDNCTGNKFSNYGAVCDIAAPGVDIYSSYLNNSYETASGTSMASPLVAAAVTYVILSYPALTPDEISGILKQHAVPEANASYSNAMCLYMEFISRNVEKLSPPVFSVEGGEFDIPFLLTLSSPDEDVTIYYTRSEFSEGYYEEYTEPILIKYDTTVKAYAFYRGKLSSKIVEHTYIKTFPNEDSKYVVDEKGTIIEYLGNDTELVVPEVIQGVKIKAVGEGAFYKNETLEYVVFPESVKTIGKSAFAVSPNLKQVRAPGIETIESSAFQVCKALESFECDNLKTIEMYAFNNCSSLKYIDFSKVETIEGSAFEDATSITSLVSNTVTHISGTAFRDSGVKIVDIPNMTEIEVSTFSGCTMLERLNIPLVTSLSNDVFTGCTSLVEINADNLEEVGRFCFRGCSSLEEVDLPKLSSLGGAAVITSDWGTFRDCTSLKKVNLPSATTVSGTTFMGCTSLEEISLPEVTVVSRYMFKNCAALKSVYLPKATDVYSSAFEGCSSLKEIDLPSAKIINTNSFSGNTYIERLILPVVEKISDLPEGASVAIGSTAHTIANYSNMNCKENVTIYGTLNTYAHQWTKSQGNIAFKEINQENALCKDVPVEFDQDKETVLEVGVIGFNRTYQWYGNTQANNTTGTLIQGATGKTFDPVKFTEYPYYYCVITSTDNSYIPVEIRTGTTKNIHTHTEVETPRVEPTCVLTGLTAGVECSDCGRIITPQEEIKTIPHEYDGVVTAPTCTEEGYTTYTCICGENYVDDIVSAAGHTAKEYGRVSVMPDCTENGSKDSITYCVVCDIVLERKSVTIPALGHTSAKAVEENYVAPTCGNAGSKDVVVYCSVCSEEINRETMTLEKTEHVDNDADGYCDECEELLNAIVECDHNCHKGGISGFFWKIINFFNKLFGLNKTCECGVAHF